MRNAKIVCTLGPASSTAETIEDLVDAGMAVARVNASHGDRESIAALLETVREVDDRTETPIATVLDLQGPEIRTGTVQSPVHLDDGASVTFLPGATATDEEIGLSRSIDGVVPGDRILIDDGRISCRVTAVDGATVTARIEAGGTLGSRKGVNVPGVDLDLPMVTGKDREDLSIVADGIVDFVAASFVRDADDVLDVNAAIESFDADVPIIAKIERADAVDNLDGIVEAAYGVMVARGDLGVECPMEDVPMIQKRIIRACRTVGVPVITATEMLDSMVDSVRPTRAEASDVANAVLDGTDAVMLSAETAIGNHPTLVVETMARIIREVENSEEYAELREQRIPPSSSTRMDAIARSGRFLARDVRASAIVAVSESGYTALKTAMYRPSVPVLVATIDRSVQRRLSISWGLHPEVASPESETVTDVIDDAIATVLDEGIAASGETVVLITGMMHRIDGAGFTNTLKIHLAAESIASGRVVVPGCVTGDLVRSTDLTDGDLPSEAVLYLPPDAEYEFDGNSDRIAGIVAAEEGLTSYPAMIARELSIPMIGGAVVPAGIAVNTRVTLDAERGVLYHGDIQTPDLLSNRPDQ